MLYFITFLVAICSLVYELLLSTLSSYLIGNSIVQFSLTIGFYLFGLGIGAFLTNYFKNNLKTFLNIEILLAILGGFSVMIIKLSYMYFIDYEIIFYLFYFSYVILIGILTGFEVPILAKLIGKFKNKNVIGDVLGYDYIGALAATLIFPFLLLPYLGLTYTAFVLGMFNLIAALLFIIQKDIKEILEKNKDYGKEVIKIFLAFSILFAGFIFNNIKFGNIWDSFFYKEPILIKEHSPYQEIALTKRGNDIRLYLNGHLQFLSLDEHRYHDSLFAPSKNYLGNLSGNIDILILGGGDGLLARNIIEFLSGKNFNITLIDLDPKITELSKTNPVLIKLNKNSLNNTNVKVMNTDAFSHLMKNKKKYDIIIADFPDPRNIEIAKLYSKEFYLLVLRSLKEKGIFTTQAGNAFFTKESFWSIYKTMKSIGTKPFPYHSYIPSFGDWGFISFKKNGEIKKINGEYILTNFDKDYLVDLEKIKENTLENEIIVKYYLLGRKRFTQ